MSSSETPIVFYWRPGCGFCMMLDRKLGKLDIAVEKRNIWEDPEAAAFVRDHARGNETVPTVAIGDEVLVNPSANDVVAVIAARA